MGVMSNGPAAKTAGSGTGIKARSNAIGEAFKTGGPKAASKAMRATTKKPFGTL
jgi:hypothetical protein